MPSKIVLKSKYKLVVQAMKVKKDIKSSHGGAVRITIPAKVAYDLPAFQKSIAITVEKLGCLECGSLLDCTFTMAKNYIINEALEIRTAAANDPQPIPDIVDPTPEPAIIVANLPLKVIGNLGLLQRAVAKIADQINHPQCTSGFDLTFRSVREFLFDEQGMIRD